MTTGSGEAPSTIDAAEMNRVRVRVEEIIRAMIVRAIRTGTESDTLRNAYLKIYGKSARTMRPNKATAYDELFGFGRNARKYLIRGHGKPSRPISLSHIENIRETLKVLNICDDLPDVGERPSTWWPLLDQAYEKIIDNPRRNADHEAKTSGLALLISPAAPKPRPASTASPSRQLRALLERMASQRRVTLDLVPIKDEQESEPAIRVRKIGPRNTLTTLFSGPHSLRYTTPFLRTDTVALLALEHDREADEWVLINALPGADLPLHRMNPSSGAHGSALHIQSAAGIFDLFLIAAVSGFSNHLVSPAQQLIEEGYDGVLSGETLIAFIDALVATASRDAAEDFAAGCFSYQVCD